MRASLATIALLGVLGATRESSAQIRSSYSSASTRRGTATECKPHNCLLPAFAIGTGGASTAYVGAWFVTRGELPVGAHVSGALAGALSTTAAVLFATTNNPSPRYQTFGTFACFAVGVPALVLGLHGLLTSDAERDELKPGPTPKWYGPGLLRVHGGPSTLADARGRLTPALSFGGQF